MLTVQVKAATAPTRYGGEATETMSFHIGNLSSATDIYALVALHVEVVIFCTPEKMRKRFPVAWFTPDRTDATVRELFQ